MEEFVKKKKKNFAEPQKGIKKICMRNIVRKKEIEEQKMDLKPNDGFIHTVNRSVIFFIFSCNSFSAMYLYYIEVIIMVKHI